MLLKLCEMLFSCMLLVCSQAIQGKILNMGRGTHNILEIVLDFHTLDK